MESTKFSRRTLVLRHKGMKIHHILLYRFKPGSDRVEEHLAAILKFRDHTEGLIDLQCGRNMLPSFAGRYTHGFIMTFASPDDLAKYNKSDAHRMLVDMFKPDIEDKAVFDLQSL